MTSKSIIDSAGGVIPLRNLTIDMNQVNPDGVCLLAAMFGGMVPEWFDLSLTQYCKTPLFAEMLQKNFSTFEETYRLAFGNLTVEQAPAAVGLLDHGTVHTEERIWLTALSGLMIVIVGMRLYSRVAYLTGSLRADDFFIVGALILTLGTQVLNYLFITYGGNGKHIYDVTQHEQANNLKIDFALDVEINVAFFFLKISFLLFYRTLSQSKLFQRSCLALGVFITITSFALFVASVFECTPFDVWKDPSTVWQHCTNIIDRQYFQAAFSCLTDFALLCLPMSVVFKVKVRKMSDRIGMLAMFGAGGLICVIGIFRCLLTFPYLKEIDWTRYGPMFMFCYVLELQLGVIVSSLPALRAFFRHVHIARPHPSSRKKSATSTTTINESTFVSEGERKRRVSFARNNLKWLKNTSHAGQNIDTFTQASGTGTGTRRSRRTWRSLGSFVNRTNYDTQRSSAISGDDGELSPISLQEKRASVPPVVEDFYTRMSREDIETGLSRVHSSDSDGESEIGILPLQSHESGNNSRRMSAVSTVSSRSDGGDTKRDSSRSSVADAISRSTSPINRDNQLESINESEIAFSGLAPRPPPRMFFR